MVADNIEKEAVAKKIMKLKLGDDYVSSYDSEQDSDEEEEEQSMGI